MHTVHPIVRCSGRAGLQARVWALHGVDRIARAAMSSVSRFHCVMHTRLSTCRSSFLYVAARSSAARLAGLLSGRARRRPLCGVCHERRITGGAVTITPPTLHIRMAASLRTPPRLSLLGAAEPVGRAHARARSVQSKRGVDGAHLRRTPTCHPVPWQAIIRDQLSRTSGCTPFASVADQCTVVLASLQR